MKTMDRIGRHAAALVIAGSLCVLGCATTAAGSPQVGPGATLPAGTKDVPPPPAPPPAPPPSKDPIQPGMRVDPIPPPGPPVLADPAAAERLRDRWGVEIVAIRPTAAGTMIDFRYRVTDPAKARPLMDRTLKATLIIDATGEELGVPIPPKVGPMRQTVRYGDATAGRVYFMFFANPGRRVVPGEKVSIVIGEFRAEHLIVQ
jgi:hypothetical protein